MKAQPSSPLQHKDDIGSIQQYPDDKWRNKHNRNYYEQTKISTQQAYALKGGLTSCPDMQALLPFLQANHSFLEIGGGYGRIIQFLYDHFPMAHITTIEQSKKYADYLKTEFPDTLHVIHGDVLSFDFQETYDIMLWMWTGICNFGFHEIHRVLENIYPALKHNGILALETFPNDTTPINSIETDRQKHVVIEDNCQCYEFIPNTEQIDRILDHSSYSTYTKHPYQTSTGRNRLLYLIKK